MTRRQTQPTGKEKALILIDELCKADYRNDIRDAQRYYKKLQSLCEELNVDFCKTLSDGAEILRNKSIGICDFTCYSKFCK